MAPDEINQDPIQDQFFGPEEGYVAALVRETLQNSLDAALDPRQPITVRFSFIDSQRPWHSLPFFKGLDAHLIAQKLVDRPQWHLNVPFLLIEDFGTKGLNGDPMQTTIRPDDDSMEDKNDFFYFWRNIGRSEKKASERGRWGLGKSVFPSTSQVRTFFALTTRSSDKRTLLMGQSIGAIHRVSGIQYAYYGYFADHLPGFPAPYEAAPVVPLFSQLVTLTRRSDRAETGLSVCIPFPVSEISAQDILLEVARSYYLPIIRGLLNVEVRDGSDLVSIGRDTIARVIRDHLSQPDHLLQIVDFASAADVLAENSYFGLSRVGEHAAPQWHAAMVDVDHQQLRQRLDAGELLAFKVPVVVHRKGGMRDQDYLRVYLQRDGSLANGTGDFIRQGLAISQINRPPRGAYRGLVIVEDGAIATLLGDSENPAHTQWKERSDRVRTHYERGAFTVRFVANSLREISAILTKPVEGVERDLLHDLFHVSVDRSTKPHANEIGGDDEGEDGTRPPIVPVLPGKVQGFRIRRLAGGFRISHVPGVPPPADLRIEAAYRTRRGNAFARYSPMDFQIDRAPIALTVYGASYGIELNSVTLTQVESDFSVEMTGFDPNRDVEIRTVERGVDEA
jgi:hypothetical protein